MLKHYILITLLSTVLCNTSLYARVDGDVLEIDDGLQKSINKEAASATCFYYLQGNFGDPDPSLRAETFEEKIELFNVMNRHKRSIYTYLLSVYWGKWIIRDALAKYVRLVYESDFYRKQTQNYVEVALNQEFPQKDEEFLHFLIHKPYIIYFISSFDSVIDDMEIVDSLKKINEQRHLIAQHYIRLTYTITNGIFRPSEITFDELFNEAVINLYVAIDEYDPYHKPDMTIQFSTFFTVKLKRALIAYVNKKSKHDLGLKGHKRKSNEIIPYVSNPSLSVDNEIAILEQGALAANIIANLPRILDEREVVILKMRFGLDENGSHTLQETGDALGITKERARQIEGKVINKLRAYYNKGKL